MRLEPMVRGHMARRGEGTLEIARDHPIEGRRRQRLAEAPRLIDPALGEGRIRAALPTTLRVPHRLGVTDQQQLGRGHATTIAPAPLPSQ